MRLMDGGAPTPALTRLETPGVGMRLVLATIAGAWSIYVLLNTARAWIWGDVGQLDLLVRRLIVAAGGMLFCLILYLALRPLDRRTLATRVTAAALLTAPVAAAYAGLNTLLFDVWRTPMRMWLPLDAGSHPILSAPGMDHAGPR